MPVHDFFTLNSGGDGEYLQLFERFLSLHSHLDKVSDELQRIIDRCYSNGDMEWCGELGPQFHELHDAWSKALPKASEKADLGELERLVKASYMIFDHLHTWQTDEHKITAEERTKKLLRDLRNSVDLALNNESMTEGEKFFSEWLRGDGWALSRNLARASVRWNNLKSQLQAGGEGRKGSEALRTISEVREAKPETERGSGSEKDIASESSIVRLILQGGQHSEKSSFLGTGDRIQSDEIRCTVWPVADQSGLSTISCQATRTISITRANYGIETIQSSRRGTQSKFQRPAITLC